MNKFDLSLAKRFVNDNSLPIPIINEELFNYWLDLYENDFHSKSKWDLLWSEINKYDNGDSESYLKHYYETLENVINSIKNNPRFTKMDELDMNKFKPVQYPSAHKEFYKATSCGDIYLSLDLTQANVQAFNYVAPEIFNGLSWEEYVHNFTEYKSIIHSKYFRSVVMGQCNPGRHITI